MKHFSKAAYGSRTLFYSANEVLAKGEEVEKRPEVSGDNSAYDPEDLVSNLLGVAYQEYYINFHQNHKNLNKYELRNFVKLGETYILECFFKEIGVVEDPQKAPNYEKLPKTERDNSNLPQNKTYSPASGSTTKERNQPIDSMIQKILTGYNAPKKTK